jgi:hypothetical protein
MPIVIKCDQCGQAMKAPDKYAGKAVKCPKCQATLRVPGGEGPAPAAPRRPAPSAPPRPTPAAPATLAGGYVSPFAPKSRPEPEPEPAPRAPRTVLLVGIGGAIVITGTLILLIWFGGKAIFGSAAYDRAVEDIRIGKVQDAINELTETVQSSTGDAKAQAQVWLDVMKNEQNRNSGDVMDFGQPVNSTEAQVTSTEPKVISHHFNVPFKVVNTGANPLTLRDEYLYLRGGMDITILYDRDGRSPIHGVVVPPGKTYEGTLPFYRPPMVPAYAGSSPLYFLIYNDGKVYVKRALKY